MRSVISIFLVVTCTALSQTKEKKFLESYAGQTVEQLIALASDYRIDSLVLAFEQAIDQKSANQRKLSGPEIDILAVEAMEREVNNGGYYQFFSNTSKKYAGVLPGSLARMECPIAAQIATDALASLKVEGVVTEAKIDAALTQLGDQAVAAFGKLDGRYFQNNEPIADRLFAYIQANKAEINLK
ncbi:MAG TPA: DUF4375 domain-containing protein [Opitutus sp.]|nr:DUF4375 domain-containing protein [Opitutus sp.]